MGQSAKPTRQNRTITVDFQEPSAYLQLIHDGKACVEGVFAFLLSLGFQLTHKASCTGGGCLTHHFCQRRALNAGKCGVEVEGDGVPTSDWMLNLQILTSGGSQCAPAPPHH